MKVAHQLWHNEYSNEICSPIMAMTKKVTTNELFGLPFEKNDTIQNIFINASTSNNNKKHKINMKQK